MDRWTDAYTNLYVYACVCISIYLYPSVCLYLSIYLYRSLEVSYLHVHVLKLCAVGAGAVHIYMCMRVCVYLSI